MKRVMIRVAMFRIVSIKLTYIKSSHYLKFKFHWGPTRLFVKLAILPCKKCACVCVCESEERYTRFDSFKQSLTLDTVFNLRWTEKKEQSRKGRGSHDGMLLCRYGRGKVFIPLQKE